MRRHTGCLIPTCTEAGELSPPPRGRRGQELELLGRAPLGQDAPGRTRPSLWSLSRLTPGPLPARNPRVPRR